MVGSFLGVIVVSASKFLVTSDPVLTEVGADLGELENATDVPLDEVTGEVTEEQIEKMTYLTGTIFGIIAAFCFSLLGVMTRKLQKIHPTTMLFSYSIVGFVATLLILIIESLATWSPWRFGTYSWGQYGWMVLASTISTFSLICNIIAAQNEKAAIIQMIGYVSLIYAFLGDYFIFDLTL